MRKPLIVSAALAALLAGAVGCSDTGKTADPKPVNVKDDPRITRELSGSDNKAVGQVPAGK